MSYPSLHEIRMAADEYWALWEELLNAKPELRKVIGQHSPTAIGWKVEGDLAPLEAAERIYELGDHMYSGPVNDERSILTIHKAQAAALDSLQDIKIMQRRPSRTSDPLGPDSLDFYAPHGVPAAGDLEKILESSGATGEDQSNRAHKWTSIIYHKHEFKILDHHVWEVCVQEAQQLL
ncbi:MAG TPA: hypothetical protein VMS08_02045 [Candidatus Saccharimonadia bacterium]|nr:hypothetical protein [Candidatus Saccharimonadia bacterium]